MSRTTSPKSELRLLGLMGMAFLLLISPIGMPVTQAMSRFFQPVGAQLYRWGVASSPFNQLAQQDERLRERAAQADHLQRENQQLRELQRFKQETNWPMVGADIRGKSTNSLERIIRINRGSKDRVRRNQAVVAGGYMVGKVTKVFPTNAEVQLVTDPNFRLTVSVGNSRTAGILKGSFGGMTVSRLLRSEVHTVGDAVYSSDIGAQVPSGIPVGLVRGTRDSSALFREADIESPISLEQVTVVSVILL